MKSCFLLFALAAALFSSAVRAADVPKQPGPEQKALEIATGQWTAQERYSESPIWPAGKMSVTRNGRLLLKGFCFELHNVSKTDQGTYEWVMVIAYDPAKKNYTSHYFNDTGGVGVDPLTIVGDTWTWSWKEEIKGKSYSLRIVQKFSADRESYAARWEYSADGNQWTLFGEGTGKKVSNASSDSHR